MPVSKRSRDETSVAASESTPASISGVSTVRDVEEAPVRSRTTLSTASSTCMRRCNGAKPTRETANALPSAMPAPWVANMGSTGLLTDSKKASSPKRACEASARSIRSPGTSDMCNNCTLNASPASLASRALRHAAYSANEMADIPATATCRSITGANAVAPMPAPSTSGHCKLHAVSPCVRRHRACASRHALPAA